MGTDNQSSLGLYKRIVNGLENKPAYLLVFGVSALFVLSGAANTVAAVSSSDIKFGVLGLLSFVLALIAVVVVVDKVEAKSNTGTEDAALSSSPPVACPNVGNKPVKISNEEERVLLADLPQWEMKEVVSGKGVKKRVLHRVYEFKSFDLAFKFMNDAVVQFISQQDHHPRWENTYNRLEVWLSTFNLNGEVSTRDSCLARNLEGLWDSSGKGR